jgi:hypothetical protein
MKTLLLLALSGLFAASLAADEPKGAKPNIIAILADPPLPRFVFTLAATGTTEEKAETGNLKAETRWRFGSSYFSQLLLSRVFVSSCEFPFRF